MATTHLLSGLPGSGKSTYAERLSASTGAEHLSLDRWLITSFGQYAIEQVGHDEHVRRVLAMRRLIWESASALLQRGADVIVDDGFFLRQHRLDWIVRCRALGADVTTHLLEVPPETLRARLKRRNAALPPHNFTIDPSMLDKFVELFERPTADEGAELVVVEVQPKGV
jgi:predicted kinase